MISQSFPRCPGPPAKKVTEAFTRIPCGAAGWSMNQSRLGGHGLEDHLKKNICNQHPATSINHSIHWCVWFHEMNNMNKWWHGDKPWVLHCQISRRAKVTSHQHLCPHETGQALNSRHRELTLPPSAAGGSATNAMALTLARHMQEIMEIIVDLVPVGVTLADSWSYCQLLLFGHVMACLKMGLSSGHL